MIDADPEEYRQTFSDTLVADLPQFVRDIKAPNGIELAADHLNGLQSDGPPELEGDLEAFKLIGNLEKAGLGKYRDFLVKAGVLSAPSTNNEATDRQGYFSSDRPQQLR